MHWRNYFTRSRVAHVGVSLAGLATLIAVFALEYETMFALNFIHAKHEQVGIFETIFLYTLLLGGPFYVLSLLLFIVLPDRCPGFFRYFLILYGGYATLNIGWYQLLSVAYEDYKSGGPYYSLIGDINLRL